MATNNDKAYFIEYLGFIEIGATEEEAVIEVANANEVTVSEVLESLARQELRPQLQLKGTNRFGDVAREIADL